jgi:hypothetical protein
MHTQSPRTRALGGVALLLLGLTVSASAQTVTVVSNVNLRPDPSSEYPPIRKLTPAEPALTLLEASPESGYYRVVTATGDTGYVWARFVRVAATPAVPTDSLHLGPGLDGSADMVGCGGGLWKHVYHPSRLVVLQDCVTVTGVIVDATANQATHRPDNVRHEPDGDTHGWLQVDPPYASLINAGNASKESGNLVFEIVCHYPVTQADAKSACSGFHDQLVIPPAGTHVAITGTLVREKNHGHWNEIHPVARVEVR